MNRAKPTHLYIAYMYVDEICYTKVGMTACASYRRINDINGSSPFHVIFHKGYTGLGRLEQSVLSYLKKIGFPKASSKTREWFRAPVKDVERYVAALLDNNAIKEKYIDTQKPGQDSDMEALLQRIKELENMRAEAEKAIQDAKDIGEKSHADWTKHYIEKSRLQRELAAAPKVYEIESLKRDLVAKTKEIEAKDREIAALKEENKSKTVNWFENLVKECDFKREITKLQAVLKQLDPMISHGAYIDAGLVGQTTADPDQPDTAPPIQPPKIQPVSPAPKMPPTATTSKIPAKILAQLPKRKRGRPSKADIAARAAAIEAAQLAQQAPTPAKPPASAVLETAAYQRRHTAMHTPPAHTPHQPARNPPTAHRPPTSYHP